MSDSLEPKRRSRLEARKPVEREEDFDKTLVACIPNLKRVAKQLTRDSYVADELLQITLIKAMQDRDTFRDNLNDPEMMNEMQRWTATILRNTYASLGRHASKNLEDSRDAAQDAPEIPGNSVELGDALDQRRMAQKLMEIIEGLPRRQRQAMELTALGKTEEEVATQMGVREGTVKRHRFRGREEIRSRLGPDDSDIIQSAIT